MNESKTPLAVATFLALVSFICGLAIMIVPNSALALVKTWTHGIDYTTIWNPSVGFNDIIVGVISAFIAGYIATWIYIKIYKVIVESQNT